MNTLYFPPSSPLTALYFLDLIPDSAIGMNECCRCLGEGMWQGCRLVASTSSREFLSSEEKFGEFALRGLEDKCYIVFTGKYGHNLDPFNWGSGLRSTCGPGVHCHCYGVKDR